MSSSRREAAFVVARWLATHEFPAAFLPEGKDRAFVQDIVYTTIRRLRPLRAVLGKFVSRWPKGELEALLYVGAAQILYMDDVPDFAAVNETVSAAHACPNPNVARVVNGVLRNVVRQRTALLHAIAQAPLDVRESFPSALVRRWIARFGEEKVAQLCAFFNEPAVTYLARPDGTFTTLARGERVMDVTGYAAGEFIVQDPGTAHAVELMAVTAGERVLDACAAPGGKTIQLAWRGAAVTACEVNGKRRRRLEENLKRVKLEVPVLDALPLHQTYSKVLVDAPCSNTGVMRRRPDARWNWTVEKLTALVQLQGEILDHVAPCVETGGLLVYSTCSIEPEENREQVDRFLLRHPEFTLEKSFESLPFETGYDGAFAAALRKCGSRLEKGRA